MAVVPTPSSPTSGQGQGARGLKEIPSRRGDRERIRQAAARVVAKLDKSRPLSKPEIEKQSRRILAELDMPEGYLGWVMVVFASDFWRDQVIATPYERRLLLLPHCLRNSQVCQAPYDEFGLLCQQCGACSLPDLRAAGLARGYRVLIAEGSPVVLQIILRGQADAVLGIGCLNSLEKSLDKLLLTGLPAMALPLLSCTCKDSEIDEDWAYEMIETPYRHGPIHTKTQVHLMRCATGMFDSNELERLLPRVRGGPRLADTAGLETLEPLAVTEAIGYDFLSIGGKHFRPFITLAAYDAMTGGRGRGADGAEYVERIPDAVKRVALAMELFHKASLVHDDIEDDDAFRYGRPTLHRQHGTAAAINTGDYLLGLGYRVVAAQTQSLGAETTADILSVLGQAHTRLCEGQGAELAWRDVRRLELTPLDALKIYALKTAPAFEAALWSGLRMAGDGEQFRRPAARFARHLGVGFQIRNDLDDWKQTPENKLAAGTDVLGGRPTVLFALALESLDAAGRKELLRLAEPSPDGTHDRLKAVARLYSRAQVFEQSRGLVAKHAQRARQVADEVQPVQLRELLHYFVDTILVGPAVPAGLGYR